MKRIIPFLLLLMLILSGCSSYYVCDACGRKVTELYECPVCYRNVCDYCADSEHFIEQLFESGEMEDYLEEMGYELFTPEELYELYAYGFASGYEKGKQGIIDDETEEFIDGYSYEWLEETYGKYGW